MQLFVTGLSHDTAPVGVRERLAIVPEALETWMKRVSGLPGVREAVVLSTCNRVEIYGVYADCDEALASVRALVIEEMRAGARDPGAEPPEQLYTRHMRERRQREAVLHLFRVAASLDSLVVGEPQILGQIKDAYDLAKSTGAAGPSLQQLFSQAFKVARKVRRETGIAQQRVSVSSVAVDLARQVWSGFAGRRVLIVGAGKMADLAARILQREGAVLTVTNRTLARAEELAARLGGGVEPWERLGDSLVRADIVFSSTGAREPVLRRALVAEAVRARRGRPLFLFDIAVPRDIEPEVGKLNGVYLQDIDDLQTIVRQNQGERAQEAARAAGMIEEEVNRFLAKARERGAGPVIAALHTRWRNVARAEADKFLAQVPDADERTRRAAVRMAESIVNKLLHEPSVALRKAAASEEDGPDVIESAQLMFGLRQVQALTSVPADEAGDEPAPVAAADTVKKAGPP
jgi:glutamyl-tRNA reductase